MGSRTSADIQRARAEHLSAWAKQFKRTWWTRWLVPERLRALANHRHPSLESVGTHAVHSISRHSDDSHAAAMSAIDELLGIGSERGAEPPAATARPTSERSDITV